MNEEIVMRTLAYLITHYKEHDETIINLEEIQAIEFLQQENARLKDKIENATKLIEEIKLHYQQSPTMIPDVKINKLENLLKEN